MKIQVVLYYHLKQKTGAGRLFYEMPTGALVRDLKARLECDYPAIHTHLDNVMMLMDKKIVLDEDILTEGAEVSFLTPVGGG